PVAHAAVHIALHLSARVFDQLVVLHARRARRHARHAAQAVVHVPLEGLVQRHVSLARRMHHVNASARRIHLFVPRHVRGTRRQAETAMHAVRQQRLLRRMVRVKARRLLLVDRGQMLAHTPPTRRPGFNIRFASNCCFTARISSGTLSSLFRCGNTNDAACCGFAFSIMMLPPALPTSSCKSTIAFAAAASLKPASMMPVAWAATLPPMAIA